MLIRPELTDRVIGAAIAVHRALGPGLLESAYSVCLAEEMRDRGLTFRQEVEIDLRYRALVVPGAYRIDFLVDEQLVIEVKSVAHLEKIHEAQLLTYLRLTGCEVGLLINFNVPLLRNGLIRKVLTPLPPEDSV